MVAENRLAGYGRLNKHTIKMDDYDQDMESAWQNLAYAEPYPTAILQFTTKMAPSFGGRVSWFSYEEAIDDWCDITELDPI